ncbi:MAG TPA: hypothetical protein VGL99_08305 [Chloroflexota bacterium]
MYGSPGTDHNVARAPTFVSPAVPLKIARKLSASFGESIASSGKIKASKKVKPVTSTSQRLKYDEAGQTKPTDRFRVPGVDPRNAEEAKEGHGDGQGVNDYPPAGRH